MNFPTRGENTSDILLSSDPSRVINVEPTSPLADHELVISDFDLCQEKTPISTYYLQKEQI